MKIAVLSRKADLYSTSRFVEVARSRGHEIHVINPLRCYVDVRSHAPSVHFQRQSLTGFDAVIPRIGASITFYGAAILRQFEMMGVFSLNESVAITRSRDKLRALQILSRRGVGMPITGFAHSTKQTQDLIKLVGGAPLVVKLLEGTQGKGVVLAETKKAAESVIDALRGLEAHFLVQEFIRESGGTDIRCLVLGDKVIASMLRRAPEGEFRANVHRGGHAEAIKITAEERATAIKAAKVLGLNFAGVDLVRSTRGPLLLEVNSSPGLRGIEKASKKNLAGMIIEYVEKHAKPGKTRTKGSG